MSRINIIGKRKGRLIAIKKELLSIEKDLTELRSQYNLSNVDFLQRFKNGELGDNENFFLWEGSLRLYEKLKIEESTLRDGL